MSATADGARLAALMRAEVVESAGRMFPVTVHHAARDIAGPRDLPDAVARAVRAALAEHAGDILAFLPGMAEIRRAEAALQGCGALVLPLHGELPPDAQDRALRPAETRRVVLATSIAETSLTVPGVRIVVDGGWRRAPRLDPNTGLTRLATLRISRAAAEQRAGRAGREGPGVAIRLWSTALHRGLPAFDRPEILEAELSSLVLDCAAWGTPPADLAFQDRPPAGALAAARALLAELGALDGDGAHHRTGPPHGVARRASAPGRHADRRGDAGARRRWPPISRPCWRNATRCARPTHRPISGCASHAIAAGDAAADRGALARIRRAATQYRRRLRLPADAQATDAQATDARATDAQAADAPRPDAQADGDPGKLLAAAFPDRIAQRRGEPGSFRLSGGGGARLPRTDPLANAGLLAVAALEMKASARIRLAAPLDPDALPPALAARVTETVESGFDPVSGTVLSRRRRRLGALVLSDRTEPADPAAVAEALARAVAADGLRALPWSDAGAAVPGAGRADAGDRAGSRVAGSVGCRRWPTTAPDWLAPQLAGMARIGRPGAAGPGGDPARHAALGAGGAAGPRSAARAGVARRSRAGGLPAPVPMASARAQAFYGLAETPRLAEGRVPLAAGAAVAGRAADRGDRRPRRVLARAPGPMCGGTCAGGIRSTTGRNTPDVSDARMPGLAGNRPNRRSAKSPPNRRSADPLPESPPMRSMAHDLGLAGDAEQPIRRQGQNDGRCMTRGWTSKAPPPLVGLSREADQGPGEGCEQYRTAGVRAPPPDLDPLRGSSPQAEGEFSA